MKLENTKIIITGAARGLGKAMAITLAKSGAKLGLIDLQETELDETRRALAGRGHACAAADITDEAQVTSAFQALISQLKGLNVLVNNAGITRDGLLIKVDDGKVVDQMSLSAWQQVIDVNLTGVFLCARAAASHLAEANDGGLIINISSISKAGNFGQTNYSASKAGVAAMSVSWASELARYGIRSVSLSPGFTATEMVSAMPNSAVERITQRIPAGRMARPDEIAETVRFIIENDYINGRDIAVDGGLRL